MDLLASDIAGVAPCGCCGRSHRELENIVPASSITGTFNVQYFAYRKEKVIVLLTR